MKSIACLLAALFFITVLVAPSWSDDKATVTSIIDGDTVEVTFADGAVKKVRLIGINAPELFEPEKNARVLAQASKKHLSELALNAQVELAYDETKSDMYGRTLAFLWKGSVMINEQMIGEGYARAYLKFPFQNCYMEVFQKAENFAKTRRLGLWSNAAFATAGDKEYLHQTSPSTIIQGK
ncbi:MAG: thermonuclease family protein [Candidatus Eremiobacteraeota bacterium]|nr:thermonuclease family protein [Candidatus Eremiobacteraeota bacterium]